MPQPKRSDKEAGDLLSTYLLQGWVMTDEICEVEDCSYPLMRSKDGSLSFCTLHDNLPTQGANHHYKHTSTMTASEQEPRSSEPAIAADNADDELQRRRELREQSSRASQLLGQKMLQRWALLNEHCPNATCYAIPLIRNPDTKQKYCVICENTILTEEELAALEKTKAATNPPAQSDKGSKDESSPSHKKEIEQELKQLLKQNTQSEQQTALAELDPVESGHSASASKKSHRKEKHRHKKSRSSSAGDHAEQYEDHKRLKTANSSASLSIEGRTVSTLTAKMDDLADRVKQTNDPCQLIDLFKSIKECAAAIQACAEAMKACSEAAKSLSQ